ncbi:hypothetical protein FisN_18Lh087 [Fistulifera solaris]|uniref:Uncharacterized protein n=1 Tax=Fistulifera solaris TaxID=1519565 RepID=A0A1Z5KDZ6_FISSO|nr:hypothetical protein FisN_18Lh087 [Fistulifera solaris]|eukprot:GAX24534.1 hypothetical protein FisN_18Lh087 [Fistulifera solaris]
MWGICPYANENNASNTLLTLFVRSDNSSAAQSVRIMYPDFFHNETLELNPTVPGTQGQIVNCSVSDDLCWNEFGIFFVLNPEELGRVCSQLHVAQKASLIQEQAAAREALCSTTNDTSLEVCQPLWQQIQDLSVDSCESVSRVDYGSFVPPNCTDGSSEGSGVASVGMGMFALTLLSSLFY